MSIRKVSIRQIKAARALLNWSQDDLAARSGVSTPTVKRLEFPKESLVAERKPTKLCCQLFGKAGLSSYLRMVEELVSELVKRQRRSK